MNLDRDGAQLFSAALGEHALRQLEGALSELPDDRPGVRIRDLSTLQAVLTANSAIGKVAGRFLGPGGRPVRAILLDKSKRSNWALGWHQDRTIAVADRVDVPGFDHWNRKAGVLHVEPPATILEAMVTLRVHLDPVDEDNGPLLIAPGSHRLGRLGEDRIDAAVERCGRRTCLAERGDIWAYATLILHASEAAQRPRRRRVLQVDYSAAALPDGLQFHGVT